MAEFLPLCDVLFNVISLAGYFCDVVFDVVMGYALLERGYKGTFAAAISIVVTSLLISQVLSMRWYMSVWMASSERKSRVPLVPLVLHALQLGVLWRYARLLLPLQLRRVKHQVRDLCMLRLVHAFCEAAPMLLLQLHILFKDSQRAAESANELGVTPDPSIDEPTENTAFAELNVISASLSLFSVCWALASFSKNVRMQNVHRLVLTWCGVIAQFLWRLGTISARICALTVYALVYEYWVFLVIGLHWVSMFLWVVSPRNVFHGERIGRARKAYLSALIAYLYVFAYVNLQEINHRQKMVIFYCVMCVENSLLVALWWWSGRARRPPALAAAAAAAYLAGIAFMLLYYRYFHVRRLGYMLGENQQGTNSTNASSQNKNGTKSGQADNAAIPGVFNCRFSNPVNSAAARKKKKPTTFVPPPAAPAAPAAPPQSAAPAPAPAPAPAAAAAFWRRPLPHAHNHHGGSSENEGSSVGSRVNIQQKLQEKKQKQLAELRVIEEEIKQGKLAKTTPVAAEEIYSSLQRQPIPRAKTHAEPSAWPSGEIVHSYQNYPLHNYPTYTEIKAEFFPQSEKSRFPRTFYENPANLRTEDARIPNYLERNYEASSSPRIGSYDANYDKTRAQNGYSEGQVEYSAYCDGSYKAEYSSGLHALTTVQRERDSRSYECEQYSANCDRFPYPGLGAKKMEQMRKMQRCRTPEILLAPHYLEGCARQVCCTHWGPPYPNRKKEEVLCASSGEESSREGPPPSDIESQISLPRSYTLPREFRYWRRRPRLRDARLPSNNSSDGDVDSAEENESDRRSSCSAASQPQGGTSQVQGGTSHVQGGTSQPQGGAYAELSYQRPDIMPRKEPHYEHERRPRRAFRKPPPKPETKL